MYRKAAIFSSLLAIARGQQVGTLTAETHPSLSWTNGGSSVAGSITLDANWRWTHATTGSTNCYTGNTWNATVCPDDATCAANCALDGADYSGTYGITTSGNALTLKFVTNGPYSTNIGSRTYLMETESTYQMFKLKNKEFTFDVDVSNLPCGLNGALYFVNMDADGGMSKYTGNKAGAKYGTGYCDSQCPRDIKFINGEANAAGWSGSSNDANAGTGNYGSCCPEMDIWEANSISTAYTPHPCDDVAQFRCEGDACGGTAGRYNSECDPDGCDFNSYRMGVTDFYGPGMTVDTGSPMTVVTQFITADGSDTGTLSEIRRVYVQNGVVIENSAVAISGIDAVNSITDEFCDQQKTVFGDTTSFQNHGGLAQMGAGLDAGMVLVMSLWDDHAVNMLWLDSTYPTTCTAVGCARGTCATTSGVPADVEAQYPNASVTYSNIKFGAIGSTYTGGGGSTGGTTTTGGAAATTTASSANCVAAYGQCGGLSYTGATCCVSGWHCQYGNDWYSQCVAGDPTTTAGSGSGTTTAGTGGTTTTTTAGSGSGGTPTGLTTTLPASSCYSALATASVVASSFNGNMCRYDRAGSDGECQGQTETGESEAVFILAAGATLSNVIIGAAQAEGVHCRGSCTLNNVWWADVCEDAATFKQTSGTSYVNGGGAFNADDKILQHNGGGTVAVKNFFGSNFGKLYRSCGNCSTQYKRTVTISGCALKGGDAGAGINTNYGDTCTITSTCTNGSPSVANMCVRYTGNSSGDEPTKTGSGPDGTYCKYSTSDITTC